MRGDLLEISGNDFNGNLMAGELIELKAVSRTAVEFFK